MTSFTHLSAAWPAISGLYSERMGRGIVPTRTEFEVEFVILNKFTNLKADIYVVKRKSYFENFLNSDLKGA